jgi:hypothetical protein
MPRGEGCFRPAVGKNFTMTVADWDDLAKRGPATVMVKSFPAVP